LSIETKFKIRETEKRAGEKGKIITNPLGPHVPVFLSVPEPCIFLCQGLCTVYTGNLFLF